MSIRLTVERETIPGSQGQLKTLLLELLSKAVLHPGFISGETVVSAFNPAIFMTISTWSSIAAWERWEKSDERTQTIEKINTLLQVEPIIRLWLEDVDAPPAAI